MIWFNSVFAWKNKIKTLTLDKDYIYIKREDYDNEFLTLLKLETK